MHAWLPSLPHTHLHTHAPIFVKLIPPCLHGHTKLPSLHPNPATSMQTPIFPYPSPRQSHPSPPFFLYARVSTITHTSMRASPLQWLGNGQQPSKPSIPHRPRRSRLWGSAPLLRFGAPLSRLSTAACSPSSSTAPAAWSTTPSAETSTYWCRGFESHVSPPSRRRHPCPSPLRRCWWRPRLRGLPRWRGMPWAVLVTGLGLPMLGSGLGLELEPNPSMLMEGSMFSQINGL